MSGFSFATLALVTSAGMAGPLLAAGSTRRIPVVVGELAIGLLLGRTGFGVLDPSDPTFALLGNVGFALVMFVVGTHVPIRETLASSIPIAALRAGLAAIAAVAMAVVLQAVFHTGHPAVYAVLMASSSAAVALPVIQASGLKSQAVQQVTAQIALADAACIVALPLVIEPDRGLTAALGALTIAACAIGVYFVLRAVERDGLRKRMHRYSERQGLALELRISLIVLFSLCALAIAMHVSIMLAGFALGLVVNAVGEPRRMARQLFGITEGLFAPLFFVWLGAALQVRELAQKPAYIALGVALGLGAILAHCMGRLTGQPVALAALSAAQLGVPVAAATLGTERHLLAAGESSALMLGALLTIAATAIPWPMMSATRNPPATS